MLPQLPRDVKLLFFTRVLRLFAYGLLSVVLMLYLIEVGLTKWEVGSLLTLTLIGDTVISLGLTTHADRAGRRRVLTIGAGLMLLSAAVFASTGNYWLLLLAATVGVISPSGNEIGPFLAIEQAALSQIVPADRRTTLFAWYNLVGSFATAFGAAAGGGIVAAAAWSGSVGAARYQPVILVYGASGIFLAICFQMVSDAVEAADFLAGSPQSVANPLASERAMGWLGLGESRGVVLRLALLFGLDAFGGGFVIQTLLVYWFHVRFGLDGATLGVLFLSANLLAGISALAAGWLASRIGLVNTMVFTHLPSNLLLILVPLMPDVNWAVGMLLVRFSISQMDVPARQAYTVAVVQPHERSAAAGVTAMARSLGAAISPFLAALCLESPALFSAPFFLAGGLKIVYDVLLYRSFSAEARRV